jgi:hypothetical protein
MTDRKLNVAMVCFEWPNSAGHTGGVGRYVHRLALTLKDHVRLTVYTFEDAKLIDGVEFVLLRRPKSRLERFYVMPFSLIWKLPVRKFDIVHSHGDDWALLRRSSLVRSFYGSSKSEARSSKGLRRWNHYVLWLLEIYSSRKSAATVAIAPESAAEFNTDLLIPPLAALPAMLQPSPSPIPSFVFIGSFDGRKRGWLAAKAVEELRAESGVEINLVVVGPQHDANQWPNFVQHRSELDDQGVASLLCSAWALLAPSSYEGFGIPSVEALNVPIRVVASKNPGNDYFMSVAPEGLPLYTTNSDQEFIDMVARAVKLGPDLSAAEADSAARFVDGLVESSSQLRLLEIYGNVTSM